MKSAHLSLTSLLAASILLFSLNAAANPNCGASNAQLFDRDVLNSKFRAKNYSDFETLFKETCAKYERVEACQVTAVSKRNARAEAKKIRSKDKCIDTWIVPNGQEAKIYSMRHGELDRHEN